MYVKQHCKFFIKILKISPNSCFFLFVNSVHHYSLMDSLWTVIRIGGWGTPISTRKLFYLRYSVNFMNGLTFFAIRYYISLLGLL